MGQLVVVSNRIALPVNGKSSAGGLAVGILDALKKNGGLWFGWNGEIAEISGEEEPVSKTSHDGINYASFSLNQNDYDLYYSQYSNTVIWPAFHYRLDLVDYQRTAWEGYCRVNQLLAARLAPLLSEGDIVWAHDYHLLPFAAELRKAGKNPPVGFFLHIPFPAPEVFNALPDHKTLLEMLCSYDLLGFQTKNDKQAFLSSLDQATGLTKTEEGRYQAFGRTFSVDHYPIGIEPESIRQIAAGPLPPKMVAIREELGDAKNIIACERLDYSKGLPERFLAYEALLEHHPRHRGHIRYTQIAPTSRGEVQAYQKIRHQLETEAGRINGKYGTLSWTPLYYLNQHFDRRLLMKIFRLTDIALITPLRDGMNLVAKEYVAAQDPENPGVLILSRFAGAACELTSALIVNPYDRGEVAAAIDQAITMPLSERIERYQQMMAVLTHQTIDRWRDTFLQDLRSVGRLTGEPQDRG
ncbi:MULTISPECIES: alpha,alpha-trehalose-phosphate synthase [Tatumella]|uniref:Trehalose-6-phosphate synthase n=2 Tax=Tatumella ptyseos TaxID=82987 RepID=A0A085JE41_9GAMM|nr:MULTISPECIES: alpha,alpha-trehalose-phosphate synthase [Tatumella]KFD18737.1 UDP-forming alpha,alpha-trehalose-phosphate synthase [Tatumella ptyseos ATCC 33301]SQK75208.1 Alpha,alpha-trehalose-phosphate synthase [UDP-forming] [Tatumella ptyseos]